MATTKKTTTTRTTRTARAPARRQAADPGIIESTERTIKRKPYASAAVATGVVSAIAAAATFLAFKKSGKSFSDFRNDAATSARDKAAEVSERVKDGLADAATLAKDSVTKLRDGIDGHEKTQSEIAEEALTLKETGGKATFPGDPVIESQTKTGAISY